MKAMRIFSPIDHNKRSLILSAVLFSGAIDVGAYLIGVMYNHISPVIPVPNPYSIVLSFPVLALLFFLFLVNYKKSISQLPLRTGIPHKIGSKDDKDRNSNVEENFKGGGIYGNKP